MDELDERLLEALRENARSPAAALARRLGLSRTTVQSRLDRLERTGVIAGYTVRVAEGAEAARVHAYVLMTVGLKSASQVGTAIRRMPAVRRLQSVSGPFDLIAWVSAPTVAQLDQQIDALGALDGVERTTSSIVLSTKIDR